MENQNAILLDAIVKLHNEVRELRAEVNQPATTKLLTFDEKLAELKLKSRTTLWRYVRDGKMKPAYIAGKPYFKPEKID